MIKERTTTMTNIELFKDADVLDAMWAKRQRVIAEISAHQFGVCNPGDVKKYYATYTVGSEEAAKHMQSPIHWALAEADTALLGEFDPGQPVVGSEPGTEYFGKYGVVRGYDNSTWAEGGFRVLRDVYVDFGDGRLRQCKCKWLKKADVPQNVLDFVLAKCRRDDRLKERVHEKVDEAFKEN